MPSEAQARLTINRLLDEAGWRLVPDAAGRPANVICEHRVRKRRFASTDDLGPDFQKAPGGFVDYVLRNDDGKAVALVEAKRESIDPLNAKEQARAYAETLGVTHVFLSNGLVHHYWNLNQGNPTRVSRFLSLDQLGRAAAWRPDLQGLAAAPVDETYIAVSQDDAWLGYSARERSTVAVNKKIRLLRDYQMEAVRALQRAAAAGKNRFLFEMATGTGKTLLSAAIAKLYLRTGNATRILFLVDRLELETQAWRNFNAYLGNDGISTVIYKERRDNWHDAQVVITTIQSLAARNRFLTEFAPTDFQLIISDEAHRTINGSNRAIFEYFIGAKLGLTATPKDYIKGVNQQTLREDDPRALERRLLLDTYTTFGCGDGTPTFRFSLVAAVRHVPPYLVNPTTYDARTEITTQMLADGGYTVTVPADEDGEETELRFTKSDYERKFVSDETNSSFVRCFLDNVRRDPLTGETGKTIFFAVSRKHATKLVELLNDEAARRWPAAYGAGSAFAVQVTSDIPGAQGMTVAFAHNNLNGKSRWRTEEFPDYDTSRTRVCVTVGMMTTGYDCEDLLNVVLARPLFSPTDFVQIKGRGTRLWEFKHSGASGVCTARKEGFGLFDFFANCEFFEKDFDYDQELELPREIGETTGTGDGGTAATADYANTSPDPVKTVAESAIGLDGMKIDREMFRQRFVHQAAEAVKEHAELREAVAAEDWQTVEALVRQLLFNKPAEFWNVGKLTDLYRTDRKPSLREILLHVFGISEAIPTRACLAEEAYMHFLNTHPVNPTRARELRTLFFAFLLDPLCRELLVEGRFAELRARDAGLSRALAALPPEDRAAMVRHIQAEIPLSDYDQAA